jgi:GTP-binding protein
MILLMDIRHPLRAFDEMMINWSMEVGLPLHILLTKADKLKRGAQQNIILGLQRTLETKITIQIFSATKRIGIQELEKRLEEWLSKKEGLDQH